MNYPGGYPPSMYPGYTPRPQVRFEAIGEAWRLFQQQMSVWILSILVYFLLCGGVFMLIYVAIFAIIGSSIGLSGVASEHPRANSGDSIPDSMVLGLIGTYFVGILLIGLIGVFLMGGLHRMAVKQLRGEIIRVGDMFSAGDVYLSLLGSSILMGLAIGVASITVIGGFLLAGLWMMTIPLIVDRRIGAIEAMQQSWDALKDQVWMAALYYFVISFLSQCGIYACGIGILFSMPLLFLIHAILYRDFFNPPGMLPSPMAYSTYPVPPGGYPPPGVYPPANGPENYPPPMPPGGYPPAKG